MFLSGLGLLIPVAVLGLIVLAITQVASDRREPDPTGRRPYAIYLFVVTFVSLVVALSSLTGLASSVVRLALPDRDRSSVFTPESAPEFQPPPSDSSGDVIYGEFRPYDADVEHTSQAIGSGLFLVGAVLVLLFHARRIWELERDGSLAQGPIRRSYQAYLYAICFVAVLVVLVGGALAIFGIVRIAAPELIGFDTASAERNDGIVQLVSSGLLAFAAYGLFRLHWRRASRLRVAGTEPEPPPAA